MGETATADPIDAQNQDVDERTRGQIWLRRAIAAVVMLPLLVFNLIVVVGSGGAPYAIGLLFGQTAGTYALYRVLNWAAQEAYAAVVL